MNKAFRNAMAGGDVKALGFLRANLFRPQPDPTTTKLRAGVHTFDLLRTGGGIAVRRGSLVPRSRWTISHRFKAYWCPYASRAAHRVTLGTAADFMFTPAITGCRLEIAGNLVIHHAGDLPGFPPLQTRNLPRGGGSGRRYWDEGNLYSAVVIGVRRRGGWRFYHQNTNYQKDIVVGVV